MTTIHRAVSPEDRARQRKREREREKDRRTQLRAAWAEAERTHGIKVSPEERTFCEEVFGQGLSLDDMLKKIPLWVKFLALSGDVRKQIGSLSQKPPEEPTPPVGKRGVYQRCLEQRLRRLEFVADRVLPFASLIAGSFDTGRKNISWKALVAAWHESESRDPKPISRKRLKVRLKQRYFDAKADSHTQEVYRYRLQQDLRTAIKQVLVAMKPTPMAEDFMLLPDIEKRGKRLPASPPLPKEIRELLAKGEKRRGRGTRRWGRRLYQRASRTELLAQRYWQWAMLSAALNRAGPRSSRSSPFSQWDVEHLLGPLRPI